MDYAEACSLQSSGEWNAATNVTTQGWGLFNYYTPSNTLYVVSVEGTTNLNGYNVWKVGDFAYSNGKNWQRIENLADSGGGGDADNVVFTPTLSNPATNVQAAIDYLGNQMTNVLIASVDMPAGMWVYQIDGTEEVALANNTTAESSNVLGFTTNMALAGQPVAVKRIGLATDNTWAWVQGNLWISSVDGVATNVKPVVGEYNTIIGYATAPSSINIGVVYNGLKSF